MTKSSQKNLPDAGIDLGTACIPKGMATDRATMLGVTNNAHDYVLLTCTVFVEHYSLVPYTFTNYNAFNSLSISVVCC